MDGADRAADPSKPLRIELEVDRGTPAAWTGIGLVVGAVLVWKLGTVAQWLGYLLLFVGALNAYRLVLRLMNPPGTIEVNPSQVTLPRGYAVGKPVTVARDAITATYFLRRSTPWNHTGPVLVIEAGGRSYLYARSWFASEADQRRILHALSRAAAA